MTKITPEALEALNQKATQGPEEYAAFVNALFDAYRIGQLVPAMPSGEAVDRDEAFCDVVWSALKGDHNDLRRQQIILNAFRAALGEKP